MRDKPRLLDLFCKAGGCTKGYQNAGFYVVGVDIQPQPRYCGEAFILGDALDVMRRLLLGEGATDTSGKVWFLHDFVAIVASPPCQVHTRLGRAMKNDDSYFSRHVDLIPQTRDLLQATELPYVIENVVGAPLVEPIMLCGVMFGLKVYRHRLFEASFFMMTPQHIPHNDTTPPSGKGKSPKGFISVTGNGGAAGLGMPYLTYASQAMGIDWMNRAELSQAIPPAYTEYIGRYLIEHIAGYSECDSPKLTRKSEWISL